MAATKRETPFLGALGDTEKLVKKAQARVQNKAAAKTRKSARTRQRIIEAATELIHERNSVDFQMSELAERCHMSKGALYYYFVDRDAITNEVFNAAIDDLIASLERAVAHASSSEAALRGLCLAFADTLEQGGAVMLAFSSELGGGSMLRIESRVERMCSLLQAQIERGQAEGAIRRDLSAATISYSVCGAFFLSAFECIQKEEILDAKKLADDLFNLFLFGIGTPAAQSAVR